MALKVFHKAKKVLSCIYVKVFGKMSCLCPCSLLRYLQSLKLTSQILINFPTKLDKIELLITYYREMIQD